MSMTIPLCWIYGADGGCDVLLQAYRIEEANNASARRKSCNSSSSLEFRNDTDRTIRVIRSIEMYIRLGEISFRTACINGIYIMQHGPYRSQL